MSEGNRFVIVGLGNVGARYAFSRHNIGFDVVDTLARRYNLAFVPGKGDFFQSKHVSPISDRKGILTWLRRALGGNRAEQPTPAVAFPGLLLKPTTLMNRSGIAARQALDLFAIAPQQLIVVVDDFNLPLGKLRLRKSGSDGGHNGLRSIIEALGTMDFPRLRVGVGPKPAHQNTIEFVLGEFDETQEPLKETAVKRAAEACNLLLSTSSKNPLDIVAAKYNIDLPDPAP